MKRRRATADNRRDATVADLEKVRMDVVEAKVTALREQIQSGDYRVDPHAVADAILRRLLSGGSLGAPAGWAQNPCSYPDSARS
jgi:hypothetical protein